MPIARQRLGLKDNSHCLRPLRSASHIATLQAIAARAASRHYIASFC